MNKVITLCDKNYFNFGTFFIRTRKVVDAHFSLYGPDLTNSQIKVLEDHDVDYCQIDKEEFETKMQYLKFKLIHENIDGSGGGITFVDFDTFFLKDWGDIFNNDIDLGITFRRDFIKQKILRAYANGGVIFCKNSLNGKSVCEFAMEVMKKGSHDDLKEYNEIFNTLENGRPAHKTHYRTTLRWWVDQVFLSSFVLRKVRLSHGRMKKIDSLQFGDFKIGFFDCDIYNRLDPKERELTDMINNKNIYIIHLKDQGRSKIKQIEKAMRNL